MRTRSQFVIGFLLVISLANTALAQDNRPAADQRTALPVTASASSERVRFTAPSSVVQIRLEVYNGTGKKVFDNEVRGGNVLDWHLQDGQAEPIADATYLCAVTVKSLGGKLAQRIGSVTFEKGVASVEAADVSQMTAQQIEALGPVEEDASLVVLKADEGVTPTVLAHNGEEGQIVRGRGALSFRLGDFFRGKDTEQMRLTAEGNLGIGVTNPQAKLDVEGAIRASQGIIFPDGTIQFSAARKTFGTPSHRGQPQDLAQGEEPRPAIAGTGTTGRLTKWLDGPSGVLGDSVISELNGSIGINGAPDPIFKLDVNGHNRFRGSNVSFYLTGLKAGGNEWLFQTVDADGRLRVFDSTSGAERFAISQSGNVGIGATSPGAKVHVNGAEEGIRIQGPGAGDSNLAYATFYSAVGTRIGYVGDGSTGDNNVFLNADIGDVVLNTAAGRILTATSIGRVGIGTTEPSAMLDVRDTGGAVGLAGVAATGGAGISGFGGDGLQVTGGVSSGGFGGDGVFANGGNSSSRGGGDGVDTRGGAGNGSGNRGGAGIRASGGTGLNGATVGLAGNFVGGVEITGVLNVLSGTKNFKIDHPLDPENKHLYHAAIESSEALNVYSGNVTTNENGDATIVLPDWFEALNRDFRYQLTVVGTFAQAIVAGKVKHNRFTIRTSGPNVEVSWQVTGVRSDAVMRKHPFKAEEDKPERERGHYLSPEAFNQPEERGVEWARNPEMMRQMKEARLKQIEESKQKAQSKDR